MEATSTAGRAGAPPAAPPPRAFTTKKEFYAQFKKKSIAHELWLRFLKNRTAVAGLIIFSVIAIVAITAPWIADYDAVVTKIDIAMTEKMINPATAVLFFRKRSHSS